MQHYQGQWTQAPSPGRRWFSLQAAPVLWLEPVTHLQSCLGQVLLTVSTCPRQELHVLFLWTTCSQSPWICLVLEMQEGRQPEPSSSTRSSSSLGGDLVALWPLSMEQAGSEPGKGQLPRKMALMSGLEFGLEVIQVPSKMSCILCELRRIQDFPALPHSQPCWLHLGKISSRIG